MKDTRNCEGDEQLQMHFFNRSPKEQVKKVHFFAFKV